MSNGKHPFEGLIIKGSIAPVGEVRNDIKVSLSKGILNYYIPSWKMVEAPKGIKMLALIMAQKEGFDTGTRSFRHNNPGNIGNTDSGANVTYPNLKAGIEKQVDFLTGIASGQNKLYPVGNIKKLKPYYSPEIAKNQKTYQLEPYCPGYEFVYTGQLDQFIKIYSTGARQKNTYLSLICSYFKNMGYDISGQTTLKEILEIK